MIGARDWLLLAISGLFTLAGLALLISGRAGGAAVATTVFFGACTGVAIWILRTKSRAAAQIADPSLQVRVGEGFGEVIVASRRRQWIAGAGLIPFGAVLAIAGAEIGAHFVVVAWLIAAIGAGLLIALALGWRKGHVLMFSDDALWVRSGPRLLYPIHWDNLAGAEIFELQSNLFIRLFLGDPARALAAVEDPSGGDLERARRRLERAMNTSLGMNCGHVMLHPVAFGVDPVVLLQAIGRYAGDPRARVELRPRAALADPRHG